ncbi:TOMM system kinase/cyclase fusion protein [Sorangium sp. So ce117]|uniref:TOMM system kinase/cyclase fusion protein n=1 Tax=Sorangium sp. So ce117 TaxID=3133277 RepID=UPI003F622216
MSLDSRQKIGAVLGDRYEILAELGEGGFGTVYKARQLATGQFVAIKVLRLGSSGAAQARERRIARFQREMQLCGQLHHPNIVRLIDSGQADEAVVYSVFEFVPGKDLAHVLAEEGPLDPREARHFMLQILDALGCAHAQGVIHRDLKPANLMVIPTGARRNLLVLDFGIGAFTEEAKRDEKTRITLTHESVGTPAYAAPEQLRGQPPTPRSDLYAWGLVFLECLTGKRVIAGDTAAEVTFNQLSADPAPIPAAILDHPLGEILQRATAKDAAARNVTADGLLRDLEACDVSGLRPKSGSARLQPAASDMRTATVELASARTGGSLSKRLIEGERRQITAVCCTLAASGTARGPLDTEELEQLLGLQQEACTMIARRFNGHVAGVLGDRVLFYFGYPTAREDAARRAAEAAREMKADLLRRRDALEAERKVRIDLRIGIHTGLVIARELRDPTIASLGYVVGTTPKLAAQLSAAAEPGSILVSGETQRLLRKHFALEEDGTRSLAGFEASVEVFHLREGSASGGLRDVPLVGRARELDMLLERWGHVRGGAGQAVLIAGEPGIGKSRLARELEEKIGDEPHTWLESRCTPDSANSAFYPVVDLLERLLDPRREAKLAEKTDKLEALLLLHGFDLGEAMPLFAPLLSLSLPTTWAPLDVSPQKQRELTRNAVLSLLFEMAEKEPIALFIEDLHWADPSTLELLGQLVGEVGSARVLALFTARPEIAPSWSPAAVIQIQLGRLGRPEVEQMARKITGGRALPVEVLDTIAVRTDGVPLFVEELVLAMIEAGALVEVATEGRYALAKPLSEVAIPATLRDLLVARLDRLGRAKETAQVAAVIGREFTFELLCAVSPLGEVEAQQDLDRLVAAELVHRKRRLKNAVYLFKHALVLDAAYESMLRRSRQQVHARVAKALEEKFPETAQARPDLLKHHYAGAGELDQAARYGLQAGKLAAQRSANKEAEQHLTDGLRWVQSLEPMLDHKRLELDVRAALAPVLMTTHGFASPELEHVLDGTVPLIVELGDSPELFPVRFVRWSFHFNRARYLDALRISEENVEVAQHTGSSELLAVAHEAHGGGGMFMMGRTVEALEHLEASLDAYDQERFLPHVATYGLDMGVVSYMRKATILCAMGQLSAASETARVGVELASRGRHVHTQCLALGLEMEYRQYLGDLEKIRDVFARLKPLCTNHGVPFWEAFGSMICAWANLGSDPGGLDLMKAISDGMFSFGARLFHSYWQYLLADGCLTLGQPTLGLAHARRALAFIEETEERWFEPDLWRVEGQLLAASGDAQAAEASYRNAIEKARAQRTSLRELRAATGLAELLASHGRRGEAFDALAPACGALAAEPSIGSTYLEQGRALLARLA